MLKSGIPVYVRRIAELEEELAAAKRATISFDEVRAVVSSVFQRETKCPDLIGYSGAKLSIAITEALEAAVKRARGD